MKRMKLLLAMALLIALMAWVVCLHSPYAPVVEAAPENVEEIWAIEDARTESEAPLVTALQNHGVPLVYDAQRNTFYCTLGMENTEAWPDIHLTAPDADGVSLLFSDDYTYDWCMDAIRDGYAYQVLAYTETEFSYFELVFTGLPLVSITSDQEITTEDSPIDVTISVFGEEPVKSYGRIHLRGASSLTNPKPGYKIEFTREADGRRKVSREVPVIGTTDALVVNPMAHDELLVRERLSWELYESLRPQNAMFGARRTAYSELFLNGEYMGIYLLVLPMDCETELGKEQNRSLTDSVYRTAVLSFSRDREYVNHPRRANSGYELYYHPASADTAFDALAPWLEMVNERDGAALCEKGLRHIDLVSMIEFDLFIQAAGMTDNVFNNMYIIAHPTAEGVRYSFAPWDMDMTWGRKKEEIGENYENWIYFPIADQLIELDAGGNLRGMVRDTWTRMRESVFNVETIEEKMAAYAWELGESGAWARNAERWGFENYYPDFYDVTVFAQMRFDLMDQAIDMIASGETVPFLTATQYEGKGTPIIVE